MPGKVTGSHNLRFRARDGTSRNSFRLGARTCYLIKGECLVETLLSLRIARIRGSFIDRQSKLKKALISNVVLVGLPILNMKLKLENHY